MEEGMKKLCILFGLASICILSVFPQANDNETLRERLVEHGFIATAMASQEDNSAVNRLLNGVITYDVDVSELLGPTLLRAFSNYSVRRVAYGERDLIFNRKLVTLLQGLEDNVEKLENTEEYVREIRIILADSENLYILARTLSLYGAIIEKNTPAVSEKPVYSPKRLYIIDTINTLQKISVMSTNNTQSTYAVLQAVPYLRQAIQDDPSITQDEFFQSGMSYISNYYNTQLAGSHIRKVMQDVIRLEIQELASSFNFE